jgi:hypothetical protein
MSTLSLTLTLAKAAVIRGETARFTLTLTNVGGAPVDVRDLNPRNETLSLTATSDDGRVVKGGQHKMLAGEGGSHPHERDPGMVTLAPGQSTTEPGDVLTWLGELEPGKYTLSAAYNAGPVKNAQSNAESLLVVAAKPVALYSGGDGARLGLTAREAVMIHEAPEGLAMYRLRFEARKPRTARECMPVAMRNTSTRVWTSWAHTDPAKNTAFLYHDGGSAMTLLRLSQAGESMPPVEVAIEDPTGECVGWPFCDDAGTIFACVRMLDGENAALVRAPLAGAPRVTAWTPLGGIGPVCDSTCTLLDEKLIVVWVSEETRVMVMSMDRSADEPGAARELIACKHRVIHVRVDEIEDEKTGDFAPVATVLCHDDHLDRFHRLRVPVRAPDKVTEEVFDVPGSGFFEVVGSAMMTAGEVGYLMVGVDKRVRFAPPDMTKTVALDAEHAKPMTMASLPMIMAISQDASNPWFVVAFISQGDRIERVRLPGSF